MRRQQRGREMERGGSFVVLRKRQSDAHASMGLATLASALADDIRDRYGSSTRLTVTSRRECRRARLRSRRQLPRHPNQRETLASSIAALPSATHPADPLSEQDRSRKADPSPAQQER